MDSFYNEEELKLLGFKKYGKKVLISKKASIYNPSSMVIGDYVRVDDFCILSGDICFGNYIHISAYSSIFAGNAGVEIGDFSGISSRCAIYAISDDYSGNFLSNAMAPSQYRNVESKKVTIGKHVIIGTGSTVLPGANIADCISIGCMSLVNKSLSVSGIYCGIPVKRIKDKNTKCIEFGKLIESES